MAELGRKGGSVSSDAKAAAARENGLKGGRPLKAKAASASAAISDFYVPVVESDYELIETIVSGGSQMSASDLVKFEVGLTSAIRGVGGLIIDTLEIPATAIETTYPIQNSLDTADGEEAKDNAALALAA
jgi:hypothetical protein